VLEHLGPHEDILASFHRALQPGGHCIIIVPAEPALFTPLDESLGHHRRYRAAELRDLMSQAGFEVVYQRQMCKAGAAGWWFNGRILKRRELTPRQMIWFDRLWPVLKSLDRVLPWPGMSLICVGRKM
jgi:Methyltransferase domain